MENKEKEFEEMAKVVESYLKKWGNPHITIIATQNGIEELSSEKAKSFKLDD